MLCHDEVHVGRYLDVEQRPRGGGKRRRAVQRGGCRADPEPVRRPECAAQWRRRRHAARAWGEQRRRALRRVRTLRNVLLHQGQLSLCHRKTVLCATIQTSGTMCGLTDDSRTLLQTVRAAGIQCGVACAARLYLMDMQVETADERVRRAL